MAEVSESTANSALKDGVSAIDRQYAVANNKIVNDVLDIKNQYKCTSHLHFACEGQGSRGTILGTSNNNENAIKRSRWLAKEQAKINKIYRASKRKGNVITPNVIVLGGDSSWRGASGYSNVNST